MAWVAFAASLYAIEGVVLVKFVALIKRKDGLSPEQFEAYYEQHHKLLGHKYLPGARRYRRRYISPVWDTSGGENDQETFGLIEPALGGGHSAPPQYDVVTEIWFDEEAQLREVFAVMALPEHLQEIVADEEKFMDRTQTCAYLVRNECDDGASETWQN